MWLNEVLGGFMLTAILFILFAWVIEMPTWLSVIATVIGCIRFISCTIQFAIKVAKLYHDQDN